MSKFRQRVLNLKYCERKVLLFVALSFRPNPSIKMGGTDRCGILFYAGSATTGMGCKISLNKTLKSCLNFYEDFDI
jgi:hypothetical protein